MNKNFNGKTVVSDGTAKTKGLKEVILEDPEFKNILYFTPSHFDHCFSKISTFLD